MLKFSVLSSGSKANCTYVGGSFGNILIDCGLSLKETERRLRMVEVEPTEIQAIFLTHEHRDHVAGVAGFARKYGTPIFATEGTIVGAKNVWADKASYIKAKKALERYSELNSEAEFPTEIGFEIRYFNVGDEVLFGGLLIEPFSVVHDANDPVGFRITADGTVLALATDLGVITAKAGKYLSNVDALVLESNHDYDLLAEAPYPWELKQRIRSDYGHLSNQDAGEFISKVSKLGRLKVLVGSHVSEKSNVQELVLNTLTAAWQSGGMNVYLPEICVADVKGPTKMFVLEDVLRKVA